jgi:hypothetical protein
VTATVAFGAFAVVIGWLWLGIWLGARIQPVFRWQGVTRGLALISGGMAGFGTETQAASWVRFWLIGFFLLAIASFVLNVFFKPKATP